MDLITQNQVLNNISVFGEILYNYIMFYIAGVQDTKVTSPESVNTRSFSNKDSKDSFMSTELGKIHICFGHCAVMMAESFTDACIGYLLIDL